MSGINITNTHMSSPATPHTATATSHGWQVSWLPGRLLDRNQATTAMVIANLTASHNLSPGHKLWPHLNNWARELGLSGPDAVALASEPPVPHNPPMPSPATPEPPSGGARLSAHTDRNGTDAHRLSPSTTRQAEASHEPEAGA